MSLRREEGCFVIVESGGGCEDYLSEFDDEFIFYFLAPFKKTSPRDTVYLYTVSLGHTIEPTLLQGIILQNGVFFGMYPTTVREFNGSVRPSPISICS